VAATFGEKLSKRWNTFYRSWLKPAKNVVLPWLAVLVVLLVVARLATPVLVATDAVTDESRRILTWWGGLLLLCAAAAVPVGVSFLGGEPQGGWWKTEAAAFWLITVITILVAALCAPWVHDLASRGGHGPLRGQSTAPRPPGVLAMITNVAFVLAVILLVIVGLLGWVITGFQRATAAVWVLGLFLAVVGVVWLAVGRGETLKLQLEVRKNDGTADANAAHYLVARLQDLGSARPRGLETPQQTDVTELPDTALKTLPAGGVAVAVNNALQLVRSAVPWHATVSLVDDDTAAITLARNGRVAEDTRRITRLQLGFVPQRSPALAKATKDDKSEKGGDDTQARTELLTAAAAYLLWMLGKRHPQLHNGLCGAKRWESIAQHATATTPSRTQDDVAKERLLATAVGIDPGNLLAQVALLQTKYRKTYELEDQCTLARALDRQWEVIEQQLAPQEPLEREQARPNEGYGALQLRLLYSRAAVWLNVQLLKEAKGHDGQVAWDEAHTAARWLVRRLRQIETGKDTEDPKLDELAAELRPAASYIWEGMTNRAKPDWPSTPEGTQERDEVCPLVQTWVKGGLSRTAHYDRACSLASKRDAKQHPDVLQKALDDLEQAVTDENLKETARRDPSFVVFREMLDSEDKLRDRYKKLVGAEPPSDFLALEPFALHNDKLRASGITTAADLAGTSSQSLAERLGVEDPTVRRWQEIARLAVHPPGGGPLDLGILQLLLRLDIHSSAQLEARLKDPDEFHKQLLKQAVDLKLVPTKEETIGKWSPRNVTGVASVRRRSWVRRHGTTAERE
jgi:hypothetical protein